MIEIQTKQFKTDKDKKDRQPETFEIHGKTVDNNKGDNILTEELFNESLKMIELCNACIPRKEDDNCTHWFCTRPKGHTGEHHAHDQYGKCHKVWK